MGFRYIGSIFLFKECSKFQQTVFDLPLCLGRMRSWCISCPLPSLCNLVVSQLSSEFGILYEPGKKIGVTDTIHHILVNAQKKQDILQHLVLEVKGRVCFQRQSQAMEVTRRISEVYVYALGRWTSEVAWNQSASMLMDLCLAGFAIRRLRKAVA